MANPNVAHTSPTLNEAIHEEGLPKTGTEAVEGAHGSSTGANHPDPTALGLNATAWVSAAMLLFLIVLVVKGVPAVIGPPTRPAATVTAAAAAAPASTKRAPCAPKPKRCATNIRRRSPGSRHRPPKWSPMPKPRRRRCW